MVEYKKTSGTTLPAAAPLARHDGVLSDLDGVVYRGQLAVVGAVEALQAMVELGLAVGYVTNNASRSPERIAEHLRSLGCPVQKEWIFGAADAGVHMLHTVLRPGARVLVVGSEFLAETTRHEGFDVVTSAQDRPDGVIQGFAPTLTWENLRQASIAIAQGAVWVATNTDMTFPLDDGRAPGNGALVAAVAAAVDQQPAVAGKPEALLFALAAQKRGLRNPLVVGDRLDTDIRGGRRASMPTALVLTGIDDAARALQAHPQERPTYIVGTMGELLQPYPETEFASGAVTCGQGHAEYLQGKLHITSWGQRKDRLDGWRAACALWWRMHAEQTEAPQLVWEE